MSNSKISALTSATTPLAGTEVLPIVQSSATVKVATNDLTVRNIRSNATTGILQVTGPAAASTRIMTVPDANFTAARTDAAQSFTGDQTLSTGNLVISTSGKGIDFSATPGTGTSELLADYEEGTWTPINGNMTVVGGITSATGTYTKVGRQVTVCGQMVAGTSITATSAQYIIGLPFTCGTIASLGSLTDENLTISRSILVANGTGTVYMCEGFSTKQINFAATYFV
jgi:hypothetical protein